MSSDAAIPEFEKNLLMRVLRESGGDRATAARLLGIYPKLLDAKIKEYALEGYPPEGR